MAVVAATYTQISLPNPPQIAARWQLVRVRWAGLANGDAGSWEPLGYLTDKSVQVFGTFGTSGTVVLEGSNDAGVTADVLSDTRGPGNALSFTAAGTRQVLELTGHVRPRVTAGDTTTALTVVIVGRVPLE